MKTLASVVFGIALATSDAQAQSSPSDVTAVTEGLIAAGMAIELGDFCDDVSVRMVRGLGFLQGLKRDLSDHGFSDEEIDAFIDDDAEKDRLEDIARGRLTDLGVVPGEPSTYCRVARGQMDQGTRVGWLLR